MLQHFLSFDKLIGTKLIKILYFLGLIGIILYGIKGVFTGLNFVRLGFFGGLIAIVTAVVMTAVGIVFWRFMCEIYMLFFRMSDDLRDIKNDRLGRPANTTDV